MTQLGWCLWVTGLSGSGKSVISKKVFEKLRETGVSAQIIGSDVLRRWVTPNPKYSEDERTMIYSIIVFVAKLLNQNGINVIIDATANRRLYREKARRQILRFMEAYIQCPLEICINRETERKNTFNAPRSIYQKAFVGESVTVPGISVAYEEPLNPEVIVDSDKLNPDQCALKIVRTLREVFNQKDEVKK